VDGPVYAERPDAVGCTNLSKAPPKATLTRA
jgi:hypothetical protein